MDETLEFFRANVMFRFFDLQGGADRVLVYLTLFAQQCIKHVERVADQASAASKLDVLSKSEPTLPGDDGWPLGSMIATPTTAADRDKLRVYFKQVREALAPRLVERLFHADGSANKHWMMFAKRKFLNKELR